MLPKPNKPVLVNWRKTERLAGGAGGGSGLRTETLGRSGRRLRRLKTTVVQGGSLATNAAGPRIWWLSMVLQIWIWVAAVLGASSWWCAVDGGEGDGRYPPGDGDSPSSDGSRLLFSFTTGLVTHSIAAGLASTRSELLLLLSLLREVKKPKEDEGI
ncbi:hypothetical protein Dimus_035169 [Dionaea muscipula]